MQKGRDELQMCLRNKQTKLRSTCQYVIPSLCKPRGVVEATVRLEMFRTELEFYCFMKVSKFDVNDFILKTPI
jgi:hypothetical protein